MPPQGGPMQGLNPGPMQAQQEARKQAWTQQQIDYANQIAKQLNESASENGPIYSPWAGAARMADALVGGMTGMKALQMQRQNLGASMPGAGDFTGGAAPTPSPDMTGGGAQAPAPSSGAGDWSPGSGVVPMEAAKAAIAGNESNGGNYGLRNPSTGALGKYQVMPQYLHDHLAAAGMPDMTPEQFLASPEAQEKQFEGEFGPLMQKHGSFNKAAIEWFGGPKGLQHVLAGNDISDGFHTGSWYLNNANATLGKLAQAQGGAPVTQGSPQGAQNAPGSTPTAGAPQTAVATPQGQQNGLPQFIPPTPGMPTRDFVNRLVMMGHPMGAQLQQQMMDMEQVKTPDGHTYIGNKYVGWHLSGLPAKPDILMPKTYGGAEVPMVAGQDAQGNTTLKPVGQGDQSAPGSVGGTGGLAQYETTKAASEALGKGQAEPVTEAIKRGSAAPNVIRSLDTIMALSNSPEGAQATSGPLHDAFLQAQEIANNWFPGLFQGTAPAEAMNKVNAQLAQASVKELTNRGTQFDFKVFLANNPGLSQTPEGRAMTADILRQMAMQDQTIGARASKLKDPSGFYDLQNQVYKEMPIRLHINGREVSTADPLPGYAKAPTQAIGVGESQPFAGGTLRRVK